VHNGEHPPPSSETLRRREHLTDGHRLDLLELDKDSATLDREALARKWRGSIRAIAAMIVLLVAIGALAESKLSTNTSHIARAQGVVEGIQADRRRAQIAACKRENVTRVELNRSNLDDYLFFSRTASLLSLSKRQPPDPRLSPRQQAEARRTIAIYTSDLERYAGDKTWAHLIENCEAVIDHPRRYHFPAPIKFIEHGKVNLPPPGALAVSAGE
jgi:hypothetical protein